MLKAFSAQNQKNVNLLWIGLCWVLFLGTWGFLSAAVPPWGDEAIHLSLGEGLHKTGHFWIWDIDRGVPTTQEYTRGKIITVPVAYLMNFSEKSMILFRTIPLFFSILTIIVWIMYLRKREGSVLGIVPLCVILMLTQPIFLEEAAYLRMYSALGLLFSIAMIALWEFRRAWGKKDWRSLSLWGIVCAVAMGIPKIDSWQAQHFPALFVAILLMNNHIWNWVLRFMSHPRRVVVFFVALLLVVPFAVLVIDQVMAKSMIGNRVMGISFITYWDNMGGLCRFLWALNVCLLGIVWLVKAQAPRSLWSWLYLSGVMGGILTAVITPHAHIFYSRYYLLFVILVVVGFSGLLLERVLSSRTRTRIIVSYIALGVLFTCVNVSFDRNSIRIPIAWLKQHLKNEDVLIAYRPRYPFNGGAALMDRTYVLDRTQDAKQIEEILSLVGAPGVKRVFFLADYEYQFRNNLYRLTTGADRIFVNDTFLYLVFRVPGTDVLGDMRGCILKVYEPSVVKQKLQEFLRQGFPERIPPISVHKKILKTIFGSVGLPTRREEILNVFKFLK